MSARNLDVRGRPAAQVAIRDSRARAAVRRVLRAMREAHRAGVPF